jgi:molybdate transport system substrate-binding protein
LILHLLGAGASKGLVTDLQAGFTAQTGLELATYFNAVGAVQEKFLAGEACDVVVLSATLLDDLDRRGLLLGGTAAPIGTVRTGVAVPSGRPEPAISTGDELAAAFLASRGIYVPDTEGSTAGIHVMRVLRALGIEQAVRPYLRPFPNGATAMRHLAESDELTAIGCTQITEIKYSPGLTLVGALPDPHGLATVYAAAVSARTTQPEAARALVTLLTGSASSAQRAAGGFDPPRTDGR